jgi:N-acetyl-gamma-glutamyl-phosphate reductase
LQHQHLEEINRNIKAKQNDYDGNINLLTFRGNFTRGIYSSLYTYSKLEIKELKQYYQEFYATHPFIRIAHEIPDLKLVVNTNKCILYLERIEDKIFMVSAIDNLLKGASGQAVQNMNLMFGFPETTGLNLKSTGF